MVVSIIVLQKDKHKSWSQFFDDDDAVGRVNGRFFSQPLKIQLPFSAEGKSTGFEQLHFSIRLAFDINIGYCRFSYRDGGSVVRHFDQN